MSSNNVLPVPLSGSLCSKKYPFIRETLTVRLPQILTKTMDRLVRLEREINSDLDSQIKQAISELQAMRHAIHTDKPFGNLKKSPYSSSWLELECHYYQNIKTIISSYSELKTFDYFLESKLLAESIELPKIDEDSLLDLLHMSLWANRKDLSLSAGEVDKSELDLSILSQNLLIDKSEDILEILKNSESIAIVLDNCGWEFFSDIKLAKFLFEKYGTKVSFYTKDIPWFISDVTVDDVERLSEKFEIFKHFNFVNSDFWTSDKAYFQMDDSLKSELSKFDAVIFKGDLNYRKLVGDLAWKTGGEDDLESAFKKLNFNLNTNVVALRTLKAEVCVGLKNIDFSKFEKDWLVSGKYGIIDLVKQ